MIEGVLINLLSQALWEFAISPLVDAGRALRQAARATTSPTPLTNAAEHAAYQLAEIGETRAVDFDAILASPEIREFVRELYVFTSCGQREGLTRARAVFSLHWQQIAPDAGDLADQVFDIICNAASVTLTQALGDGGFSRSPLRQRIISDHLRASARKVDFLASSQLSLSDVGNFEAAYRSEMVARAGSIMPPDFHSAPRVPIDDLYVIPALFQPTPGKRNDGATLDYHEWLGGLDRCVVLGNPGAGKSTLARKVCYDLARDDCGVRLSGRTITPTIVVLKDYAVEKQLHGYSIRAYLESRARTSHQMDVPDGMFGYLLSTGRLFVIFDGLDELLNTHYRQDIRDDVESFGRRYPGLPILVTSREVGYQQAPLEPFIFHTIKIEDFDDDRVTEYATKWFCLDTELEEPARSEKTHAFISESRTVPDLRGNPLMLALLCNFYRGQGYIPRNRPDVYERCARMLFDEWDKRRGIDAVLPIIEHLRPTMQYLASWIYSDESLHEGVTREQLIVKTTEFLCRWRFDDEHRARHAAVEFVDFCRERAWVFSDLGSTESGDELFQFTHRTFLEYFTAAHLVASYDTSVELIDTLAPYVADEVWAVVPEVAVQLRSRASLAAADEMLERLLEIAGNADEVAQARYIVFAVRTLGFIVPTPNAIQLVMSALIQRMSEIVAEYRTDRDSDVVEDDVVVNPLSGAVDVLATISSEIADPVKAATIMAIERVLTGGEIRPAGDAARVALLIREQTRRNPDWADAIGELLFDSHRDRITAVAARHELLAIELVNDRGTSTRDVMRSFGPEAMFRWYLSAEYSAWSPPLAVKWALVAAAGGTPGGGWERAQVSEIGSIACCTEMPWIRPHEPYNARGPWEMAGKDEADGVSDLDEQVRVGLFVTVATCLDMRRTYRNGREALGELERCRSASWKRLGQMFRMADTTNRDGAQRVFVEDRAAQEMITAWLKGDVRLAEPRTN